MKLVDTTVAVDHLRGEKAAVRLLAGFLDAGEPLVASEVTRFELLAGVRPRGLGALEDFFAAVDWLPVTEAVTREAGALARRYLRSHSGIGTADYLIAATAIGAGADPLTTNVGHFPMFPGLRPPY